MTVYKTHLFLRNVFKFASGLVNLTGIVYAPVTPKVFGHHMNFDILYWTKNSFLKFKPQVNFFF